MQPASLQGMTSNPAGIVPAPSSSMTMSASSAPSPAAMQAGGTVMAQAAFSMPPGPSPAPGPTGQPMQIQQQVQQPQHQQSQYNVQRQHYQQQQLQMQRMTAQQQMQPQQAPPQQQQQQQQMQQQQAAQHHIPHQGLNGGWQSDKDVDHRRKMIEKIAHLLQQRKPNAPPEWLKKLPQMAKRLEESLYRDAPSFEAYNDVNTLKKRLLQLAVNVGMKTKKLQPDQIPTTRPVQNQPISQQPRAQPHLPQQVPSPLPAQGQPQQPQPQMQLPYAQQPFRGAPQQQSASSAPVSQPQPQQDYTRAAPGPATMQPLPQPTQHNHVALQPQPSSQVVPQQPPQRQMVNMSDINPTMGGGSHAQPGASTQNTGEPSLTQMSATPLAAPASIAPAPLSFPPPVNGQAVATQIGALVGAPGAADAGIVGQAIQNGANGSRPDRQQVLRHQQQRLLLLRHAAKCPHEDGQCRVTPHCAGMKRLWKHIAECKNQKCTVPHCVSSRYVLSHYHRCKDAKCPVCGPVREAIHRSHEKQKQQTQLLKQRHEQELQARGVAPAQTVPAGTQPLQPQPHAPVHPQQANPAPQQLQSIQPQPPSHFPQPMQQQPLAQPPTAQLAQPQSTPATQTSVLQHQPQLAQPGQLAPQQISQQPPPLVTQAGPAAAPATVLTHPGQVHSAPLAPTSAPLPPTKKRRTPDTHSGAGLSAGQTVAPAPVFSGSVPVATPVHSAPVPETTPQVASMPSSVQGQDPGPYASSSPTVLAPVAAPAPPQVGSAQAVTPAQTPAPKPQEDHTLINCFTLEQIETHIASLNKGLQLPPAKLKSKCLEVLKGLQSHRHGWVFNAPVDPVELSLPDYFEVIKRPMDLGTIKKRLENGCYQTIEDFRADVNLTFDNAMLYNPEGSVVYNMAEEMQEKFKADYDALLGQLNAEEDEKRKNGDACTLCGCEQLAFEPPVYYCNGTNCPSKRIRRNSYYYVDKSNQFHWCHQCFQELKDNNTIEVGEVTLKKGDLTKKKNDETHEESWVHCDKCKRWIHQICGLFNTRKNKDQRSEYACPRCTVEERKKSGTSEATSTTPMADDLPRTKLSQTLENHVKKKTAEFLESLIQQRAKEEDISVEEARKKIPIGGPITIRQVTSMDRKLEVRERMKKRYAFKNYPHEFTFRCKCLIVFQNLDGVDVILFGLYVYEHDEKNPAPNNRAVYISYLDSVHYMRPRQLRTFVYHEILISYLDYVRKRGFATAHIWACPPLKGDDYILYAKPEDQKTPKDERLRQWYIDMLVDCQRRGIVGKITNMFDLYFADHKNDATVVPYMDGDYFPAEVENIIKDLEEGKNKKTATSNAKKKKGSSNKAKSKNKAGRGGTRSTGLDEEALAASGIVPPGVETKSLQEGGRDFVMAKLGEIIQPMKESFIVAYLAWDGAKPENLIVPPEISEYRKKHGVVVPSVPEVQMEDASNEPVSSLDATTPENSMAIDSEDNGTKKDGGSSQGAIPDEVTNVDAAAPAENGNVKSDHEDGAAPVQPGMVNRKGKFAAMSRKRDSEGTLKPEVATSSSSTAPSPEKAGNRTTTMNDLDGREWKVLDDDIEEMDCEFLNNRQAFLNLCQGNHYQFDHLRRAKHTSMMVLWHLHNRDQPKFVQQCAGCSRDIMSGYRFHCETCPDFDLCQDCVKNPNTPRHPHQLKPIAVSTNQQNELTDAQRRERQRNIQLHMTLLYHAATCDASRNCPSANCQKMKGLLKHGATCQVKAAGGCNVCKRIWALLQIHARQCKNEQCPVPNCMKIRERSRQLTKQQQAMDDRRRQEMNRAYRGNR